MSNLIERIKAELINPNGSPWFPDLTAELADAGWENLYRSTGMSRHSYTTSRVMTRDANSSCRIVAYLPTGTYTESIERSLQVEILDGALSCHYEQSDIRFYTSEEIDDANVLETLADAIEVIKRFPTLHATIATLVKSIHIIKNADDDYDVSFSEPYLPFSIFLSVPRKRHEINTLRVAEAVIHEAMHLQLTLIELIVPLIKSRSRRYYSPWRREFRNIQGILHGLYVFCVIDEVLRSLSCCESAPRNHIEGRLSDIHTQLGYVQSIQGSEDLTEAGISFVQRLMTYT